MGGIRIVLRLLSALSVFSPFLSFPHTHFPFSSRAVQSEATFLISIRLLKNYSNRMFATVIVSRRFSLDPSQKPVWSLFGIMSSGECPICGATVKLRDMNDHIDGCLATSSPPPLPSPRGGGSSMVRKTSRTPELVEQAATSPSSAVPRRTSSRGSIRGGAASAASAQDPVFPCPLCKTAAVPLSSMFVLDECSHRFCRTCIEAYAMENLLMAVGLKCPAEGCNAMMSIRDCNMLAPKEKLLLAASTGATVPRGGKRGAEKQAPKSAPRRLMEEFRGLASLPATDGIRVEMVDDNLFEWNVYLSQFDPKDPIAQDLQQCLRTGGSKEVCLKVVFPETYPLAPPFVRVLRPRFQFMTGHVTSGGSVCFEMLTSQGWTPHFTVEAVLVAVRANLVAGGARLDLGNRSEYSEREAKDAFDRMLQTHGWK